MGRHDEAAERAANLGERLASGGFHIAVVGEFKRGKSTLINALIGTPLLPTGVLPVTAVATEIRAGEPGAMVVGQQATFAISLDEIGDYVTESGNPDNIREVKRVVVTAPAAILAHGVVLVDTPGIGSVFAHNTTAGLAAMRDVDGAIVVLSADEPLSQEESEILAALDERQVRSFVVINKSDHVAVSELDEIRAFLIERLSTPGARRQIWALSARRVLEPTWNAAPPECWRNEFEDFRTSLQAFIRNGLVDERLQSARREIADLGRRLLEAMELRDAALKLDATTLRERIEQFRRTAARQHDELAAELLVLAHATAELAGESAARIRSLATAPDETIVELEQITRTASRGHIDDELRRAVEAGVRTRFELLAHDESLRVDRAWERAASQIQIRTQQRINDVRAAAAQLFSVSLPSVDIPKLNDERGDFSFLFINVGSVNEPFIRVARRLTPSRLQRARSHERAKAVLTRELDKHAGRLRHDIQQRLEQALQHFEAAMRAELDQTIAEIANGVTLISAKLDRAEETRTDEHVQNRWARAVAEKAISCSA